jgi:hypothetical protein
MGIEGFYPYPKFNYLAGQSLFLNRHFPKITTINNLTYSYIPLGVFPPLYPIHYHV